MKANYNIVKCGHSDCVKKNTCTHYNEHTKISECKENCTISGGIYKCYTIIEQRKIKLEKLINNEK